MPEEYYKEIIKIIKTERPSKEKLSKLKNKIARKYKLKKPPTDIEIFLNSDEKEIDFLKKYLKTKPTRTISGVSVVAVMTKPRKCPHGKCIMCPGGVKSEFGNVPQSYTGKEPATRRAIRNNYDSYLQIFNRLEQYAVLGHNFEKIELIIMGGTFLAYPKKYKEKFVMNCFKAMNDFSSLFFRKNNFDFVKFKKFFMLPGKVNDPKRMLKIKQKLLKIKNRKKTSLEKEQTKNEKSNVRCVGLTIETRPDYAMLKHGNEMLRLGCTRVEIGIQSVYDFALKNIERGHTKEQNIESIKILKDLGFKINIHYMLGLPGVDYKKEISGLKKLFEDENYRPDMLKLYPCMVLKGTKLYNIWKQKKFNPITTEKAAKIIAEFKKYVEPYCRIMRVQRDIPSYMIEAGVNRTNLRQYIEKEIKKKGIFCRCIRCREIKEEKIKGRIKIKTIIYKASNGLEFFISAETDKHLIGFCRLRFPSKKLREEITKDSALIRELHVYGTSEKIGASGKVQHKGIGKKLLETAENISKMYLKNKIVVISGVGVREYYKKLGYRKERPYMVKKI